MKNSDLDLFARFTGGLPFFAHLIGDAVWRKAPKPTITENEILKGILSAADDIGDKYIQPEIFAAIRSERYRSILRKIADDAPKMQFRKAEILKKLDEEETKVLANFLQRMEELGDLKRDPEIQGVYQFPTPLHALYFYSETQPAKQTIDPNMLLNFSKKTKYKNKNR